MLRRVLPVVVVVTLAATGAFAGWAKQGKASAVFNGSGPGGFKIEGKTEQLDVKDDGTTVTVVVNLTELDTGISLRDKHMREKYLEVGKFPETTLAVPLAQLKIPENGKSGDGEGKGSFTLHGVTKEQAFKYSISCDGAGLCEVKGTMPLNMNDYGISVPKYLGITVKPDLTVSTTFPVKRP